MTTLREKSISGVAWRGFSSAFQFVLNLVISIILMRLIGPDQYGIIAKIIIVMTVFNIFLDFGFSQAIIQEKNITDSYLSTQFWISIAIGLFLAITLYVLSPFFATFYEVASLKNIFIVFAISILFGSTFIVQRALMHKRLQFKKLAIISIVSVSISAIIGVYLAVKYESYTAVVAQLISSVFIQGILTWFLSDFSPSQKFDRSSFSRSSNFSIYLFIADIIRYLVDILDQFLISIMYSQSTLGLYNRSLALIKSPARILPDTFNAVLFPLFSTYDNTIENDRKINDIYYKIASIISFFLVPIFLVFWLFAHEIVLTILGETWLEIIEYSKIIALIAIVITLNIEGPIYLAKGQSKSLLYLVIVNKSIILISIFIGIQWDIITMLYCILFAEILVRIIKVIFVRHLFSVNILDYCKHVFTSVLLGILVTVVIYFICISSGLKSSLLIVTIALLYSLLIFLFIRFLPIGAPKYINDVISNYFQAHKL